MQSTPVKIATFNVNSVRARTNRLLAFLERQAPDVVCLQELKCLDAEFPSVEVSGRGYQIALHGQKTYNGVAILSRTPIADVTTGVGDAELDVQSRVIFGTVEGVRIVCAYFPNGGEMGSDKWVFKLKFMAALRERLAKELATYPELVLTGDFNVAPFDDDVARPAEWGATVLCHPEARAALERIRELGFVDGFRPFHPDGGVHTWWDYRGMGFERGNGLRIDHFYVTAPLAKRVTGAIVDRAERAGEQASDHAPVMLAWE